MQKKIDLPNKTIHLTKGLLIKKEWLALILSKKKTLEMRSRPTKIRGYVGLIQSGSGLIFGLANLVDCIGKIPNTTLIQLKPLHCIDYNKNIELKKYNFGWKFENAIALKKQIPYTHPKGAVVWVNLNHNIEFKNDSQH